METEALRIWVITDGRAGNEAQALGLAEAIARRRPAKITVRRVAPKAWTARLPAQLWHAFGAREGGWPFTAYSARVRRIKPPWPDLVIGAGRRIAPERDDVAHACLPVAARDLVHLGAARADAGQMRRRHQRGFAQDSGDGGVGALARRAAGAVSDRYETRAKRFEPLDRRPQDLLHLLGPGGKELEGDLGARQIFPCRGTRPVRCALARRGQFIGHFLDLLCGRDRRDGLDGRSKS